MPKIIFQPLMISNPPGYLVGLKSAWNASFCKGLHKMKVTTQPVPLRPERAEAPSPGHRPGLLRTQTCRPVRAKALKILG